MMDKLAVIRSIVGLRDEHSSFQSMTGFPMGQVPARGEADFGSVVSRVQGPVDPVVPPFIDLFAGHEAPAVQQPRAGHPRPDATRPARMEGDDLAILSLPAGVSPPNGSSAAGPARPVRQLPTVESTTPTVDGMNGFYQQRLRRADLRQARPGAGPRARGPRLRDRYGRGSSKHLGDGAPMWNDQLLIARRLVEAGVRCVTVAYGFWDTHGNNFGHLRKVICRMFDQGISALVEDIYDRGPRPRRLRGRLGRVRPHAEDQQPSRPRPLGAGEFGDPVRRRHERRPGDRLDRQARRLGRRPAGPLPGRPRHHLPQPRHRPRTPSSRDKSDRPVAILSQDAEPIPS